MQHPPPDPDRQEDHPLAEQPDTTGPLARPVFQLARRVWNPVPIPKPVISIDLEDLPWPERSAEVVRHALLSVEHWLSRSGWIREWVRLNLWLAVVLIVAALLIIPPVTALLEGVRDWSDLVSVTMINVNVAMAKVPPIVLALATGFLVVKLIQRYRGNRRPRRHDCDEYR